MVKKGSNLEYQYILTDHQGNTRVVFSSATPAPVSKTATFEGTGSDNSGEFLNVVAGNIKPSTLANHTSGGSSVIRMNQTYPVGPAKSLKVYPGDKINIEVWEYHEGTAGFGTSGTPASTLITMVAGVFGGVSGAAGESGSIYNGVSTGLGAFGIPNNADDARPAAYLNYILFDKNYKALDAGWQAAPDTTFNRQKLAFSTITVPQEGYLYTYLSYESPSNNWVYFDDFKVTQTASNIVQYNEYYPFGLQTADSWTREGASNRSKYNGGTELNETASWYETPYRAFDPAIGRFLQVDALADQVSSLSPYSYAGNNPASSNDPTGLETNDDNEELIRFLQGILLEQNDGGGGSGGTWSRGSGYHYFGSEEEANQARNDYYNYNTDWWGYTMMGSAAATDAAMADPNMMAILSTSVMLPSVTVKAPLIEGWDPFGYGKQQGEPTRDAGGFIDGDEFYNYMKVRAETWKIEVAAVVLKNGNDYKYFILPWKNNEKSKSDSYANRISEVLPGYTLKDVSSFVHTHNIFGDPMPSPGDIELANMYGKPVYVISPKKDYVVENGQVKEYDGF